MTNLVLELELEPLFLERNQRVLDSLSGIASAALLTHTLKINFGRLFAIRSRRVVNHTAQYYSILDGQAAQGARMWLLMHASTCPIVKHHKEADGPYHPQSFPLLLYTKIHM